MLCRGGNNDRGTKRLHVGSRCGIVFWMLQLPLKPGMDMGAGGRLYCEAWKSERWGTKPSAAYRYLMLSPRVRKNLQTKRHHAMGHPLSSFISTTISTGSKQPRRNTLCRKLFPRSPLSLFVPRGEQHTKNKDASAGEGERFDALLSKAVRFSKASDSCSSRLRPFPLSFQSVLQWVD